jgi:hypothetical protein
MFRARSSISVYLIWHQHSLRHYLMDPTYPEIHRARVDIQSTLEDRPRSGTSACLFDIEQHRENSPLKLILARFPLRVLDPC